MSGYGHYINFDDGEDPATYQILAEAMTAVTYEVWKARHGFHNFDSARGLDEVYFEDPSGTHHQATLVARVTTPQRAPLWTPVPSNGNPNPERQKSSSPQRPSRSALAAWHLETRLA